jgi:hypothetical protein
VISNVVRVQRVRIKISKNWDWHTLCSETYNTIVLGWERKNFDEIIRARNRVLHRLCKESYN